MKKFSKLILETKKELWTKHPLVNSVDWDEIFKPLIEHIDNNLKDNVPSPGEGVFGSETKAALDGLIDAISEDYKEYFVNVVADDSKESFFNAYDINVDWDELMDCLHPIMDRTDVDHYPNWNPNWDGGYWCMDLEKLKYKDTDELIEDILDVRSKLKMFNSNHMIKLKLKETTFNILDSFTDEKIKKGIRDLLELPGQDYKLWVNGLKSIEIFIYNKDTVQSVLD